MLCEKHEKVEYLCHIHSCAFNYSQHSRVASQGEVHLHLMKYLRKISQSFPLDPWRRWIDDESHKVWEVLHFLFHIYLIRSKGEEKAVGN